MPLSEPLKTARCPEDLTDRSPIELQSNLLVTCRDLTPKERPPELQRLAHDLTTWDYGGYHEGTLISPPKRSSNGVLPFTIGHCLNALPKGTNDKGSAPPHPGTARPARPPLASAPWLPASVWKNKSVASGRTSF